MSKVIMLFNLVLFFSLVLAKHAIADEKLTCVTTHYPPYTIFDKEKKTFIGSDIELLLLVFKNLGIELEIINLPWVRLKQEIKKSNYDCYFSLGKFPSRETYLDYTSIPLHVTKIAVFSPQEVGKKNSVLDLSKKVVGVHRGIDVHLDIANSYKVDNATIYKLPSNEALFKMLSFERVDAIVTSKGVGMYLLANQFPKLKVNISDITDYKLPAYLAFRKEVIDINRVNKALLKINKDHSLLFDK